MIVLRCSFLRTLGVLLLTIGWSVPATAASPQHVVTLAPSLTEIVFALGAGERLIGVSSYCDYPPQAATVDRVGTFLQPMVEVILKKQPDIVFAVPSPENRSAVESLEKFGLRVRVVRASDIESTLEAVRVIAADLELVDAGARLVERMRSDVDRLRQRLANVEPRRVLMVVGRRPLIAVGAGTYQHQLIELAGGQNIAAAGGEAWPHLSIEHVIASAPQVIIDSGMGAGEEADRAAFWAAYPTIPAVRDERVVGAGRFDLLRAGPRVAESLEAIARFIHPELFADPGSAAPSPAAD